MNNKFLLIGNPNVGKTTVFNSLTGLNEKVSNFEGVTVSKKEGKIKYSDDILVDLPGISSLGEGSIVSKVVSKTLIEDDYSSILYVLDLTNIKKSIYMLIDILETKNSINVLLNMSDIFSGEIDIQKFEDILKVKAHKISKADPLNFNDIDNVANNFEFKYDIDIEKLLSKVIENRNSKLANVDNRYLALQFIRGNEEVNTYFDNVQSLQEDIIQVENTIKLNNKAQSINGLIFLNKRSFINNLLEETIKRNENVSTSEKLSILVDKIVFHKFFGYIIFLFIMWIIFLISFRFSFLGDYIDIAMQYLINIFNTFLININSPEILRSFLINGIMAGITSMLVFLPQILILFSFLTLLEGCGYFSRVTVLFENLLNKIGLSAHSLIPLISGLGCNVLSVMSTRTIRNENKRIATILASPFISCSARFPVYLIFIEIFFQNNKALILLSLYVLGILVALLVAYTVDKIIYKEDKSEVIITQLSSYKMVSMKYFLKVISKRIKGFIFRAGKLIVIGVVIMWVLSHFGANGYTEDISNSFLYGISGVLAFVLVPLGFGTREAASSLLAAFFAKEMAISAMVVSYNVTSPEALGNILQSNFTFASAYSFMVFTLLYIPCISTLGAIYSETKSRSLVIYSILISLGLGYVMSFIIYNILNIFK